MNGNGSQWIETGSESHVGLVRSVNQDRCAEFEDGRGNRLLVVADGMGGHRGGETASRLAVEAMGEIFGRSEESLEQTIRSAVETANERIHECAGADADLAGMGTTIVGLALGEGGEAWVAHVGDSRLYLLRQGKLDALTADHSLVAEMHRQGFITAEEAQVHPRRNELTRSVGVASGVDVEISRIAMRPGDRFLLCSDGLCGYVGDEEIRQVLESEPPLGAARVLVDRANAKGGYDNVTVQVVAIAEDAPLEAAPLGGDGAGESGESLLSTGREPTDLPDPARATRGISRLALTGGVLAGLLAAAAALWVLLRG
jgi:protein phosphatase